MADELVSVVIPVYNGERFLAQAIESVHGQTWREVEVIVVDDGSSDRSGEIARRFASVRCLRQDNAGQAAARNRGAAAATGPFLAFLDADDLWLEDKLERQLAAFRSAPDLAAVFGWAEEFVEPGQPPGGRPLRRLPAQLPSAMLIRRTAFAELGGYDPRWRLAEVADFYSRLQEAGLACRTLDHVVYRRRLHGRNLGVLKAADRVDYVNAVAAALARRRQRPAPK
jgi:glycosyltransferase involved in cell wall biosynthesis